MTIRNWCYLDTAGQALILLLLSLLLIMLLLLSLLEYVCVFVCVYPHTGMLFCVWCSKSNFWHPILSFYHGFQTGQNSSSHACKPSALVHWTFSLACKFCFFKSSFSLWGRFFLGFCPLELPLLDKTVPFLCIKGCWAPSPQGELEATKLVFCTSHLDLAMVNKQIKTTFG